MSETFTPAPLDFELPVAELEDSLEKLRARASAQNIDLSGEISALESRLQAARRQMHDNLTSWQRVQIARHSARPYMLDYMRMAFDEFVELHGDRLVGDDAAMPGGFAIIDGIKCVVIGHQKGRNTKENILRNFGSAHPEGYRKALRLMEMAQKFHLPVVTLIDTPGAFPGIGAEERNIAEAIARNLREMMVLETPIISIVLGEGGSGGALGIGVADRVLMMENSYYSVISPEGCAAILWKHRKHAPDAAEALKLSAPDLFKLGLIDGIIPEPEGGAHHAPEEAAQNLRNEVARSIRKLSALPVSELLEKRYEKFRRHGQFFE